MSEEKQAESKKKPIRQNSQQIYVNFYTVYHGRSSGLYLRFMNSTVDKYARAALNERLFVVNHFR